MDHKAASDLLSAFDQPKTTPLDAAEAPLHFVYEPVDDGWPGYEEPTFTTQ